MTLTLAHVLDAESYATRSHDGQFDKAGRPYIEHPNGVAWRLGDRGYLVRVVAWLHDIVEDTGATLADVRHRFGDEVADAVDAITHRKNEPRDHYYARVKANPTALTVKASDLADNTDPWRTRLLEPDLRARLAVKYAYAYEALGLNPPEPTGYPTPVGRIPVVVGDFATRDKDEVLIVWSASGADGVRAVLTKCPDWRFRGTPAARDTLRYDGVDDDGRDVFSLEATWTVTGPVR